MALRAAALDWAAEEPLGEAELEVAEVRQVGAEQVVVVQATETGERAVAETAAADSVEWPPDAAPASAWEPSFASAGKRSPIGGG